MGIRPRAWIDHSFAERKKKNGTVCSTDTEMMLGQLSPVELELVYFFSFILSCRKHVLQW